MASEAGRGAQVILDEDARKAARGALAGSVDANAAAKRALEAAGTTADGLSTIDGSTRTGIAADDAPLTIGGIPAVGGGGDVTKAYVDAADSALASSVALKQDAGAFSGYGLTLVDDVNAAAARTTLGLGTAATSASSAFATASHTHPATDITSGVLPIARLGTNTAAPGQYLDGNNTWQTLPAAGGGGAPLDSPAFTGTPTAPTAMGGTSTNQLATTLFVANVASGIIAGAPTGLDTLDEIAAAIGDDPSFSTNNSAALALKAPLASPTFTGTVTIPSGASISGFAPLASPTFTGTPAGPTATAGTSTTQFATTAFATTADALKAPIASPTFTGTVTIPSGASISGYAPLASPTFTGTPAAPTQTAGNSTTALATTAFATTADNLKANLASPTFTGTPAAPTQTAGNSTTALATTAFVTTADNLKANIASPTFTGVPAAPTPAEFTSTTQIPTTAFVTPYLGRGVVKLHAGGVVTGDAQVQAVRIANATAMQANITNANTNGKFLEAEPAFYCIENSTGMVIPVGGQFNWHGVGSQAPYGTILKQYASNAPILTYGDPSGSSQSYNQVIDGVTLQYGASQAGSTSANAMVIGKCWMSIMRNVDISANWNGTGWDNAPYRGIYINCGGTNTGFFSNMWENIRIKGVQQNAIAALGTGTGNVFTNIYLGNGGPSSIAITSGGPALHWSTAAAGQWGNTWNQLNVEWFKTSIHIQHSSTNTSVFNGIHMEGNRSTGFVPILIYSDGSNIAYNGVDILDHRFLVADGMDPAGTGTIFGSYNGAVISGNVFSFQQASSGFIDRPWQLVKEFNTSNDVTPSVEISSGRLLGAAANLGTFDWDLNMVNAGFPKPSTFRRYTFGRVLSTVDKPIIDAALANMTHYGSYREGLIRYPAVIGAARTVTLSDKMKSTGSLSTVKAPTGALCTVRRGVGTADGFNLLVVNGGTGAGTLSTISTSDTEVQYRFDGTNWAVVT